MPAGPRPAAGDAPRRSLAADVRLRARGSRRAAAPVSGVALAGDVRRRRCRARSRRRSDRPRQDLAALSIAGLRASRSPPTSSAYQHSREMSGVFQIAATAAPGVRARPSSSGSIIDDAAEVAPRRADRRRDRARAARRPKRSSCTGVQTIGGFGGKSDQLNAYNVFRGDPGLLRRRSRALRRRRHAESIRQAVRRLARSARPRVALSVVPHGARHLALPDSTEVARRHEPRRSDDAAGARPAAAPFRFPRDSPPPSAERPRGPCAIPIAHVPVVSPCCSCRRHRRRSRRAARPGRVHRRPARRGQRRALGARDGRRARALRRRARHRRRPRRDRRWRSRR